MDYTPKVFTKENPCTKVDLHNCFYRKGAYVQRMVIEARTEIGLNAPKYLIREGYIELLWMKDADYYRLTPAGVAWLSKGLLRFLQLHPEKALECVEAPSGHLGAKRRAQARKTPANDVQAAPRVIRRPRG